MKVIYLDQNQWIRLARAVKHPKKDLGIGEIAHALIDAVNAEKICLPLTATTIYETYKIGNTARRKEFATFQAAMSRGIVFIGRHARLTREIANLVRDILGHPKECPEKYWFLSNVFIEAFAAVDDPRIPFTMSTELVAAIKSNPPFFLLDYLTTAPDDERRAGVENWSLGSESLRRRVERRREKTRAKSMNMRRRIYSAQLFIDELDVILEMARKAGAPWQSVADIEDRDTRRIICEVPIYHVERELALRLESQDRAISENDFRDMMAFCAVVPYADCVFAEKQFVNLTRQAGLHDEYGTIVSSDIADVGGFL